MSCQTVILSVLSCQKNGLVCYLLSIYPLWFAQFHVRSLEICFQEKLHQLTLVIDKLKPELHGCNVFCSYVLQFSSVQLHIKHNTLRTIQN